MTTTRTHRSLAMTATIAALACATAAPAPAMPGPEFRGSEAPVVQDLRSPDAIDAANGYSPSAAPEPVAVSSDLRSPDVRDAAAGYDPQPVNRTVTFTSPDDGFDWLSAAIGGAVLGGLILLLVAFRPTHLGHRGALHT